MRLNIGIPSQVLFFLQNKTLESEPIKSYVEYATDVVSIFTFLVNYSANKIQQGVQIMQEKDDMNEVCITKEEHALVSSYEQLQKQK